jgi:hypothetical protein
MFCTWCAFCALLSERSKCVILFLIKGLGYLKHNLVKVGAWLRRRQAQGKQMKTFRHRAAFDIFLILVTARLTDRAVPYRR